MKSMFERETESLTHTDSPANRNGQANDDGLSKTWRTCIRRDHTMKSWIYITVTFTVFGAFGLDRSARAQGYSGQSPPPRWILGVQTQPVLLQDGGTGLGIISVIPGGPGQKAGLEPGDIILEVDGQAVEDMDSVTRALNNSNGVVRLTLIDVRTMQRLKTDPITLAGRPSQPKLPTRKVSQPNGCTAITFSATGMQLNGLRNSTGNPMLDAQVNQTVRILASKFGVSPRFYFFLDGNSPNALSTPEAVGGPNDFPVECSRFGTVLLGLTLMSQELADSFSVPAILAHEWTHTVQFQRNCRLSGARRELHADYLAGWYIRFVKDELNPNVREATVFSRFYERGDGAFNDPNHHGTPKQRLDAFLEGFGSRAQNVGDAYNAGMAYVARVNVSDNEHSNTCMDRLVGFQSPYAAPTEGDATRRWVLGVMFLPVPVQGGAGLQVVGVTPNSPAHRAGFEPGDIILTVNDQAVTDQESMTRALNGSNGTAQMTIINIRDFQQMRTPPISLVDVSGQSSAPERKPPQQRTAPPTESPDGGAIPPSESGRSDASSSTTDDRDPPDRSTPSDETSLPRRPTPEPRSPKQTYPPTDSYPPREASSPRWPNPTTQLPTETYPPRGNFPPRETSVPHRPNPTTWPPMETFPPTGAFPGHETFPPVMTFPTHRTFPPISSFPTYRTFPPVGSTAPRRPSPTMPSRAGTYPPIGIYPQPHRTFPRIRPRFGADYMP